MTLKSNQTHSHNARELVYKSLDAADHADVNKHALMTCASKVKLNRWSDWTKTTVTHGWKSLDASTFDSNDKRRRSSGPRVKFETLIVRWDEQSNDKGPYTKNVQHSESVIMRLFTHPQYRTKGYGCILV